MGRLVLASVSAKSAIALQQPVQVVDHLLFQRPAHQGQRNRVERVLEVVGRSQGFAADPHDAEQAVVGHDRPGTQRIDVFGRQGHADDGQPPFASIDDGIEGIAGQQAVRCRKCLVEDDLPGASRLDVSPNSHVQAVQLRRVSLWNRNEQTARRFGHAGDIEHHGGHDPRFDPGHAGNGCDSAGEPLRRPLDRGKDLREAIALVIRAAGLVQRAQRAQRHYIHRNAATDDQGDGQGLQPDPAHVAVQFAIEGPHRITTPILGPAAAFR